MKFPTRFLIIALVAISLASSSSSHIIGKDKEECVYTIYVRTGSGIKSGTDANISLTIGDPAGGHVNIGNLQAWGGLMGPDHDYFERGNLDTFSGRGPCGLSAPICSLNLTSDGGGSGHGWYCEYVEVTATGPHVPCMQTLFYVRQWLASDVAPYRLNATVDGCQVESGGNGAGKNYKSHFVIGDTAGGGSSATI